MKQTKIVYEHELIEATINFNKNETTTFDFDLPKYLDATGLENLKHVIDEILKLVGEQ